jgi:Protein of unknown function (DUF998)
MSTLIRVQSCSQAFWAGFVRITAGRRIAGVLVGIGLAAAAVATAMVVGLHMRAGADGVNPVRGMLSDYELVPDGWVFKLALVIAGCGSVALWAVLVRHHVLRGWICMVLMALWCAGLVGIALFPKDPFEGSPTDRGGIHLLATAVASAALPTVGVVLGLRHRRHAHWRRFARITRWLAVANMPCLLPFVIPFALNILTRTDRFSGPATGLIERIMGGIDVALLIVIGLWGYSAAHHREAVLLATGRRRDPQNRR